MARRLITKLLVALVLVSSAGLGGCVVAPYGGYHYRDGGHDYPHHYYRRW